MKNYKPKKSLGQNFLKSSLALNKIIEAGEIKPEDIILEIGPGKGALTEKLLEKSGHVMAVEKDRELFDMLSEKFREHVESGSLVLVHGDILDFDQSAEILKFLSSPRISGSLSRRDHFKNLESPRFKIIANIPYNITGAILKKFLTASPPAGGQPECMVLMVQQEVARRIVAGDGKESILSISVKAYGNPKMIMKVDKRYFSPAPKVNSAVIKIDRISRKVFTESQTDESKFWEIVKKGFAHKRKKLSSNLKGLNYLNKYLLESLKNKRAEDLSLKEWIDLCNMI